MSTKFMNFMTMCWFISVLICVVVEGGYFGEAERTVINDLTGIQSLKIGGLTAIPAVVTSFFRGLYHIMTWDYVFYTGSWEIIRWMWLLILTPGVIWGATVVFAPVVANFLRLSR